MKIIILALFFLTSCSSYVRTLGTRMISPETHGGLGHGALEARVQAMKRDRLDFSDDMTTNAVDREDTPHGLGALGEIGFFKKLDLYILPSFVAPTVFGIKYQFIGSPKSEAKEGNFSTSLLIGYGERTETEISSNHFNDFTAGEIDKLELKNMHHDFGIISGYRWHRKFLHYANVIYLRETVKGKVTTDSGSLTDAKFKYYQDGLIYSTGFIHYFSKAHWKLDYSHFVSDWTHTHKQTVNALNASIGFDW